MSEIQPANIKARRDCMIGVAFLFVATLVLNPIFDGLGEWLTNDPNSIQQKIPVLVSGIVIAFIPLLFAGFYCWRLGRSIIVSGRFPAPKMKVLVDTPIVRGPKARRQGQCFQLLGLLLSATAIGFPLAFWWVIVNIQRLR